MEGGLLVSFFAGWGYFPPSGGKNTLGVTSVSTFFFVLAKIGYILPYDQIYLIISHFSQNMTSL